MPLQTTVLSVALSSTSSTDGITVVSAESSAAQVVHQKPLSFGTKRSDGQVLNVFATHVHVAVRLKLPLELEIKSIPFPVPILYLLRM